MNRQTKQPKATPTQSLAMQLATCSQVIDTQQPYLVLLPEGEFMPCDGRALACKKWVLTPENGKLIVDSVNAKHADMLIDYEHQTILAATNGKPAPASGWIKHVVYMDGVGVCTDQWEWTPNAELAITGKEYKYLSPVFLHDPVTGVVTDLLHVALTNNPAIDILPEVALAAASAFFATALTTSTLTTTTSTPTEDAMEEIMERLRYMLNLPTLASPEDIKTELEKVIGNLTELTGDVATANKTLPVILTELSTVMASASAQALPNPTQFVPIAVVQELQAALAATTAQAAVDQVEPLIAAATSQGKQFGEAMLAHLRVVGKSDLAALQALLDSTPAIPALASRQTQQVSQPKTSTQSTTTHQNLDEATLAVASQMGVSVDNIAKYGA